MGALGQYVHLTWANYKKAGTFEFQAHNPQQRNNFKGDKIFKQHRQIILSQAGQLKEANLKALETKYNLYHQNSWNKLKGLVTKAKKDKTSQEYRILTLILKAVNNQWALSTTHIDRIISSLSPGQGNTLKYTGGALQNQQYSRKVIARVQWEKGKKNYIGPLWQKTEQIKTQIQNLETETGSPMIDQRNTLMKIQDTLKSMASTITLDSNQEVTKISGVIPAPMDDAAPQVVDMINGLIDEFSTIAEINFQLRYQIPEILGQIGAQFAPLKAEEFALNKLETYLQDFKRTGSTLTAKLEKTPNVFKNFNPKVLDDAIRVRGKETYGECKWNVNAIGEGRAGKVDVNFWGKGISLKTTDMGLKDFSTMTSGYTNSIALQSSSSLLLYLLGIEEMHDTWGTHYMNALVQHEDEQSSELIALKNVALNTLKLHLLYSALTGAHQLRMGQQADVFAIYDTARAGDFPRIRFYDMGDIVLSLDKNPHAIILEPSLESIASNLLNEREPTSEDKPTPRKAAEWRISKLLVQLRNHVVKVSIAKDYLQKLYMVRNTKF